MKALYPEKGPPYAINQTYKGLINRKEKGSICNKHENTYRPSSCEDIDVFASENELCYIKRQKCPVCICDCSLSAENYIPKITFIVRPNDKPWMSNAIKNQMRKRDRLYHKAKSSKSPTHWQNYKNKRNEVVDLIRSAKSEYMKKLQSSLNDPKLPPKKLVQNCE